MSLVSRLGGLAGVVLVSALPAQGGFKSVGVPGINGVSNVPSFDGALNDAGQVAFRDGVSRILLWEDGVGPSVVAQVGDPAPGTATTFTRFGSDPRLNDVGEVAFRASLGGSGGIFGPGGSGLTLLARTGDPAPGTGGTFQGLELVGIAAAGEVTVLATLTGAGVDSTNDGVVYLLDALGATLVAREGDAAPGVPGHVFRFLGPLPSDLGPGLRVTLDDGSVLRDAVYVPDGSGGLTLLALEGDPAPGIGGGITLGDLTAVANDLGEVVLGAELVGGVVGDGALYAPDGSGGLTLVVRVGDPAPGGSESFVSLSMNPEGLAINNLGEVAFTAKLEPDQVFGVPSGIWATDGQGGLREVAPPSQLLPDDPGEIGTGSQFIALNDLGDVAGADFTQVIFFYPSEGGVVTLVHSGDGVEVAPGDYRTVMGGFTFVSALFAPERKDWLNDLRQVIYTLRFEDDFISGSILRADLFTDCNDGDDDDGDGFPDPADPGCTSPADPSERGRHLACDDAIDNDGDGGVDVGGDLACEFPASHPEDAQCQDGIDNDGQLGIDFDGGASLNGGVAIDVPDPQCDQPWRLKERKPRPPRCGTGAELLVVLLPIAWFRARRRKAG